MQVRVVGQGEQIRGRENPSMTRSHARDERQECRDADNQQEKCMCVCVCVRAVASVSSSMVRAELSGFQFPDRQESAGAMTLVTKTGSGRHWPLREGRVGLQ